VIHMPVEKIESGAGIPPSKHGKFPSATKALSLLDQFKPQENVGETREPVPVKANKTLNLLEGKMRKLIKAQIFDSIYGYSRDLVANGIGKDQIQAEIIGYLSDVIAPQMLESELLKNAQPLSMNWKPGRVNEIKRIGAFISAMAEWSNLLEICIQPSVIMDRVGSHNSRAFTVFGDVGEYAGDYMSGGVLAINGNCGESLGWQMSGGTIQVNGNIKSLAGSSNIVDGNIYQRGRQLVKDGEIIAQPINM